MLAHSNILPVSRHVQSRNRDAGRLRSDAQHREAEGNKLQQFLYSGNAEAAQEMPIQWGRVLRLQKMPVREEK